LTAATYRATPAAVPKNLLLAAMIAVLAVAAPARAWNDQGHIATGLIAFDSLGTDPGSVAAIMAIMALHPDRARFDAALGPLTGTARTRRTFALMARWPDDIRGTGYDRPGWHYAVKVVSGATILEPLTFGDAIDVFAAQLEIAEDPAATPARRAVALCWVFHLVGDMHQPLHGGHRVSWRFLRSDRAGTIGWVRTAPGAKPVTFHEFWDSAADRPGDAFAAAQSIAAAGEAVSAVVPPVQSPVTAFASWVAASRALAASVAYRGMALAEAAEPASAPVLPAAYQADARRIAERRIGEAGRHLAGLFAGVGSPPPTR